MALSDSIGLLFRISAKNDVKNAVDSVVNDITGLGKKGEQVFTDLGKNIGLSTEALAGLTSALPVAGVALAGVGAVAFEVTERLFNLAEAAADYGSKIHDAGERAGVTAETISALKFAADESGSSLEAVSGSVAKFTKLLGDAENGNDKAQATLARYNVTARDTDVALGQAIKTIAEMTDHNKQAAAAAELFKDRTGEILPVIKSFDGNLPALISHLREMGLIMSQDDANAADEFGDQMDTLNKQLTAVKVTIGTQLLPTFLEFAQAFSKFLTENKTEIKSWADTIAKSFRNAILEIQKDANDLGAIGEILNALDQTANDPSAAQRIDEILQRRRLASQKITNEIANGPGNQGNVNDQPDDFQAFREGKLPFPTTQVDEEGKKAAAEREKERQKAAERELDAQKETIKLKLAAARQEYQIEQHDLEAHYLAQEITEENFRKNTLENLRHFGTESKKALKDQFTLDSKDATATERKNLAEAARQADQSINSQIIREREDALKTIETVNKKRDEAEKKSSKELKKALDERRKSWSDYIKWLEDRQDLYDKEEQRSYDEKIKSWKAFLDDKKEKQDEYDREADRSAKERADLERQQTLNTTVGSGQDISAIGQLSDQFALEGNTAAIAGIEALTEAFNGLGQALGQVVQSYVLYGTAGASVRQVTAQILAGIAQQAAVKAIFELAEGFAALALSFFGMPNAGPSAGAHFAAAAIYGSIAGVAALAGRAVAGDSFKKQAAGGGASAGGNRGATGVNGETNTTPLTRQSSTATDSGTRSLTDAIRQNTAATNALHSRIESMPAGEVLMTGIRQNPNVIAKTMVNSVARNASFGKQLNLATGNT